MKKLVATALIGGAALGGVILGAGNSDAKIEPGHYKSRVLIYGVIPLPESNAHVVGNRIYEDVFGFGPRNYYTYKIIPTKDGGTAYRDVPNGRQISVTPYKKTRYGYKGENKLGGVVPNGATELRRVR